MNKEFWVTVVFALEQYIQDIESENSFPTPHIYNTLRVAVENMERSDLVNSGE